MDKADEAKIGLELMAQAEAIRRLAITMREFYRMVGQPDLWDLTLKASWPEGPRWFDVQLDPLGDRAVENWKRRVGELLGETGKEPPPTE